MPICIFYELDYLFFLFVIRIIAIPLMFCIGCSLRNTRAYLIFSYYLDLTIGINVGKTIYLFSCEIKPIKKNKQSCCDQNTPK